MFHKHHGLAAAALLLPGALLAQSAPAGDVLTLKASTTLVADDNFRQAPASEQVSERVATQTFGIKVSKPVSLQRFELDADISANKHQNFSGYDYTAQNYRAAWLWSYTPQLFGTLSFTRKDSLNAIVDSVDPTLRNKNTTNTGAFTAAYGLTGQWQLVGGLFKSSSVNEQALVGGGDTDANSVSAGVRYAMLSGTYLGYNLRRDRGTSNSANNAGAVLSSSYTATSHDFLVGWPMSVDTALEAHLLHQSNSYDDVVGYDFSGVSGGLKLKHKITEKTSINIGWDRALTSNQTESSVYTVTDSFSVAPSWQITPKTSLGLQYKLATRSDRGSPAGGTPIQREDRLHDASLNFSWAPRPFATLTASMGWASRSSNLPDLDYAVKKTTLAALFTF